MTTICTRGLRAGVLVGARSGASSLLCPTWLSAAPTASLVSKATRGSPKEYEVPWWPYWKKGFSYWGSLTDTTLGRLDANSRFIVVEGLPGTGKAELAQRIAEEFEFLYVPSPNVEMLHSNKHGLDLKSLNPQLLPINQFVDYTDFLKNPTDWRLGKIAYQHHHYKYRQCVGALFHMLNTGQGVVMTNSVFMDFCYWEAMVRMGYMAKEDHHFLRQMRDYSIDALLRPHLVINMDIPVERAIERIQESSCSIEAQSPVFNKHFCTAMIEARNGYLRDNANQFEIMSVDPDDALAMEYIADDLEAIDLDSRDNFMTRFSDWETKDDDYMNHYRYMYGRMDKMDQFINRTPWRMDVLNPTYEEEAQLKVVLEKALGYEHVIYDDVEKVASPLQLSH